MNKDAQKNPIQQNPIRQSHSLSLLVHIPMPNEMIGRRSIDSRKKLIERSKTCHAAGVSWSAAANADSHRSLVYERCFACCQSRHCSGHREHKCSRRSLCAAIAAGDGGRWRIRDSLGPHGGDYRVCLRGIDGKSTADAVDVFVEKFLAQWIESSSAAMQI